jgi:hypothetical protein
MSVRIVVNQRAELGSSERTAAVEGVLHPPSVQGDRGILFKLDGSAAAVEWRIGTACVHVSLLSDGRRLEAAGRHEFHKRVNHKCGS